MADGYWNRRQPNPPMLSSGGMLKRPRTDYDVTGFPAGYHRCPAALLHLSEPETSSASTNAPPFGPRSALEMPSYLARDDDHGGHLSVRDTNSIGSAYDRYLQSAKLSSFTSGEASAFGGSGRAVGGAMPVHPIADPPLMGRLGSAAPDLSPNGHNIGYSGQHPVDAIARPGRDTVPLPPDASNTLYVEGFPPDSTRREVARILYIFRPFVGYKEVRLVSKEPRQRGGDPILLCFVDFSSPACAATAMSALQGYKMDEHDPDSNYLRLQFSRYPGPRSGPGTRGRR
ncbi:RNA-binding with multiple splicing [Gossypium arboreum]|uniref:RNA-binding with multiple splicing n=1 Tax=Gossypium arboreum TaxID=29729 RepID=A0A0B0PU61_GOSAR|nr:RNA-binding with multiple splicing [Gossypium arboreum]